MVKGVVAVVVVVVVVVVVRKVTNPEPACFSAVNSLNLV